MIMNLVTDVMESSSIITQIIVFLLETQISKLLLIMIWRQEGLVNYYSSINTPESRCNAITIRMLIMYHIDFDDESGDPRP